MGKSGIAGEVARYGATLRLSATAPVVESPLFLLDCALRFVRVAVLLALWRALLPEEARTGGMALQQVLTYALIAEVLADPLECRTELHSALWDGSIARRFLQPASVAGQFAAEMAGRWAAPFWAVSLPLLLLAPALGVDPRPADLTAGLLFVPSLLLGITVGLALEFIFGALAVALEQSIWVVLRIRTAVGTLLSGALVPLALLPERVGEVFAWLPFAAMASAPLRIYTGSAEPGGMLLLQLGWALALWWAAAALWRAHRERLVCHGG